MIRLIGSLFSMISTGVMFAFGGLAGLVYIYGGDLPAHDELVDYRPKMLSRVYSGEGRVIAEFYRERRVFVPVGEIPELVKNAFISAEDKNFYTHPGIDAVGIAKAVARYVMARAAGRPARLSGASTITQQVVKNFLVGRDRNFERKIMEAILAVRISGALSKDSILELYLNDSFLGQNTYGVAAAAQRYYGKTLEELTPADAAYLAALPQRPSKLHPVRRYDRAVARRNYVLEEMAQNGHLSRQAADTAKQLPLVTIIGKERPKELAGARPSYFSQEVRRQLIGELGEDELYEGGLTIRATIESDLQGFAASALRRALEGYDRRKAVYRGPAARISAVADGETSGWRQALAAIALPRDIPGWFPAVVLGTGETTALVGIEGLDGEGTARLELATEKKWIKSIRRDGEKRGAPGKPRDLWQRGDVVYVARAGDGEAWTMRQIPEVQGAFMAMDPFSGRVLAMQGGFSFEASVFNRATRAMRQPGSAFKPFVYAAALDAGYTPATVVLDAPIVVRQQGQDDWRPRNASNDFFGPAPMRLGLELSRNLMTVRIAQQVGMDRVANYAERFGVYQDMPYHLSYALGAGETTLYNMVAAYGMFANGGKRVRPTVVDRVQDHLGNTLFRHDPRLCRGCAQSEFDADKTPLLFDQRSQIMDPVTAYQLVSMMQGVVQRGTAARTVGGLGFPVAGKTGTTNEARDAWFIGFTATMVAGCYIGYDIPTPMGRGAYGGSLCGPAFKEFMAAAMATRTPGEFRGPGRSGLIMVKIDRETGERLPDDEIGAHVITEMFQEGTEPVLYGALSAISGDDALFGGFGDELPFTLDGGGDRPFQRPAAETAAVAEIGGQPRRPAAPVPGAIGLGTGGLY